MKDTIRKRLEQELAIREADAMEVVVLPHIADPDAEARKVQATYADNSARYTSQVQGCANTRY